MRTGALRTQIRNDAAIVNEMATTIAAHAGIVAKLRLENQRNLAELVRLRGAPVTPAKTIVDEPVFPLVSPNVRPFEHASPPSPQSPCYQPSRSIPFNLVPLPIAIPLPLPVLDFASDSESEN